MSSTTLAHGWQLPPDITPRAGLLWTSGHGTIPGNGTTNTFRISSEKPRPLTRIGVWRAPGQCVAYDAENIRRGRAPERRCREIRDLQASDADAISTRGVPRLGTVVYPMTQRAFSRARRFSRLTNAFSKKVENHFFALAIYFMHYNYVRVHQTLRMAPAMAAGVSNTLRDGRGCRDGRRAGSDSGLIAVPRLERQHFFRLLVRQ